MRLSDNAKKNRGLRRSISMLLLAGLFTLSAGAVSGETLAELKEQQDVLQAQKSETETLLAQLKDDTAQKKAYRDTLYVQIDTVQSQLDLLREQIDGLDEKIVTAEAAIADKNASIDVNFGLLKERIRSLYITGDASTISLILDSRSVMDYTEKTTLLKAVTTHDQELIDTLTTQMKDIQDELDAIHEDKIDLSKKKTDLDVKSSELGELYAEAQLLVTGAESEEVTAKANSEQLGAAMEENEAAIRELEEQIKNQQAAGGGSAGNLGGGGFTGSGSFIWPMPGYTYLTCYYGDGGHRGIDVAGGDIYGKAIVAADGGTVTYAGWNDSYGYCVFIDHGNGFETRYAHMSALGTSTGASVSQSEVIGYVGSTGNSTGPHLHFEVISGGGLTDPMGYF